MIGSPWSPKKGYSVEHRIISPYVYACVCGLCYNSIWLLNGCKFHMGSRFSDIISALSIGRGVICWLIANYLCTMDFIWLI